MDTSISANWERLFSSKKTSHTTQGVDEQMIGPIFDIGPGAHNFPEAKTTARFHFDQANLNFGQRFSAFSRFYPNFSAGGTFLRIKQKFNSTYSDASSSVSRTIQSYSTFLGAGPKLGFDFDYRMGWDFFFNVSSSMGLIIGESQNGTTYLSWAPDLSVQPNNQYTLVPNRTQLVPALEERIGFSYGGVFKCCKVTFGFGYQAQVYIDAIQSIDMTAPQVPPSLLPGAVPDDGVYAVGFERTISNFILTGPYISLGLVF
jgi:hypothetical protein